MARPWVAWRAATRRIRISAAIVVPLVTGIVALFAFMFVRSRQQARRLRTEIDALGNGRE